MKKKIIIVLSILIVIVIATISIIKINNNSKYVVEINGEKVSIEEFKFMLENVKIAMMNTGITDFNTVIDGVKQIDVAKEQTLENILGYKLGAQEAAKKNINLEESEITETNNQINSLLNENSSLNEYLKKSGLSVKDFKKINLEMKYTQKVIEELVINKEFSDQEIRDHYTKNAQNYVFEQEKVRARHILLKTHDRNENGELVALPKERQDDALVKANEALQRAKNGENFEELVAEFSEDDGSVFSGGEYIFGRGEMVEAFENTAFSLEINQISNLVQTEYGYHIIKLEEKYSKGQIMSYELVKNQVISEMQYNEYNKLIEQWKENATIIKNDKVYNSII